jgi:membrane protein
MRQAFDAWREDDASSMGAALSYYAFFSMAPLLVMVVAVAGVVFSHDAVMRELTTQIQGLLGDEGAKAIMGLIQQTASPKQGLIAGAIGIGLLIFGATTVCVELQDDLDRIWEVPARESGIWSMIHERFLSFGLILGVGFLLMMSLALSAALSAFGDWWSARLGLWEGMLQTINIVVSLGLTTMLFAMIYKILPRVPIAWNDVWVGAFVTASLVAVGKYLIGLYLGRSAVSNDFGAAGSLVVVLIWVYYTAQIFLLGAEFTWVYAHRRGSKAGEAKVSERSPTPQAAG